jgi:hypothetical protein
MEALRAEDRSMSLEDAVALLLGDGPPAVVRHGD